MNDWYYVEDRERVGPVDEDRILSLLQSGVLTSESFIWRKGFEDWKKLEDVPEITILLNEPTSEDKRLDQYEYEEEESEEESAVEQEASIDDIPPFITEGIDWDNINRDEAIFSVKIGLDRGTNEVEYGPYSLNQLRKAFDENRINAKTYIFSAGMENWILLGDMPIYTDVFQALPPSIEEIDRRQHTRKPFVARMFFHDNKEVFEGVCRDVSIGGMQILVSSFPTQLNEIISLNVHPENNSHNFVAKGRVVRVLDGDQGFSLRFEELSSEAKGAIMDYLKTL